MESGLPDCTGVALGFDRLALWCLGGDDLSQVIPFPFSRA
jgi:lysyl-tRNA synthetase class 2